MTTCPDPCERPTMSPDPLTTCGTQAWPDDATVERAAEAGYEANRRHRRYSTRSWADLDEGSKNYWRTAVRTTLATVRDTVLPAQEVREIVAQWDERGATWCMKRIAALLAGGEE